MAKRKTPANFECPESGEACTDTGCTKDHCCEHDRLAAAENREAAAKKIRKRDAKILEIIEPKIRGG